MDRKTKEHNRMAMEILCAERKMKGIWSRPAEYAEQHTFGQVDIIVPGERNYGEAEQKRRSHVPR